MRSTRLSLVAAVALMGASPAAAYWLPLVEKRADGAQITHAIAGTSSFACDAGELVFSVTIPLLAQRANATPARLSVGFDGNPVQVFTVATEPGPKATQTVSVRSVDAVVRLAADALNATRSYAVEVVLDDGGSKITETGTMTRAVESIGAVLTACNRAPAARP